MTQVTLDGSKLKAIAHSSHTAIVTTTSLALRERLRHFSDIARTKSQLIRSGEKIVEADYMKYWKDLQAAGVGSIIYGRKGKPDRFEWHYSLKSVSKAALEGTNEQVEKITNRKFLKEAPASRLRPKLSANEKIELAEQAESVQISRVEKLVYIPLRKDFNLEINLPSDVTKDEVEIINSALRRLSA